MTAAIRFLMKHWTRPIIPVTERFRNHYMFLLNGASITWAEKQNPKIISILEVGFGTGLNALLTVSEAIKNEITVAHTSLETFPLGREEGVHMPLL